MSLPAMDTGELAPGTVLGNLVIKGPLGRGGMGVVYLAADAVIGREVAVKLLPRALSQNAELLARFLAEARAAGRLEHPNVVAIYQAGEHAGTHYIVMPLVRGGSAADMLVGGQPLPWRRATELIRDACRGLAAAHAAGIIHRDLKPANLLVGADGAARVADFGLSRAGSASQPGLTNSGQVMGTPAFMSPEQCQAQPVDHRTDIYSIGATYFMLLAGREPFVADSAMQVMFAHCSSPVPDARELRADVPEHCAGIAFKAMAKDPADRWQSAAAMADALDQVLASAAPDSAPGAGVRRGRTAPVPTVAAEAVTPAPIGDPRLPGGEPARPARSRWPLVLLAALLALAAAMFLRGRPAPDGTPGGVSRATPRPARSAAQSAVVPPAPAAAPLRPAVAARPGVTSARPAVTTARPAATRPAPRPTVAASRATDLLRLIDPARDAIAGDWSLRPDGLGCAGNAAYARLEIPYAPPAAYTLRATIRRDGQRGLVAIAVPVSGSRAMLVLDWWDNRRRAPVSGFELIDGRGLDSGLGHATPGPILPTGQEHALAIAVSPGGLSATLDGSPIDSYAGGPERLAVKQLWAGRDPRAFVLGTFGGPWNQAPLTFRRLTVEDAR